MFYRLLPNPKKKIVEEPKQWKKVFKAKCKVPQKCCNLIIDGRNTKNLVSMMAKRKFNLMCISRPTIYEVLWLEKGYQVTMIEQCLLNFQIGNFRKQGLCDVVEMDACHVLPGRPWLFDIKKIHDGRENAYEFKKYG